MESNIKVNFKYSGISNAEILKYAEKVKKIHNILNQNIEKKQNFTGWITWPCSYDKKEFEKIKKIANKVKKDSQVLIVIGIGGSYLGARAVIESLTNKFKRDDSVEILYVGNNLNANYINEIIDYVSDKDISINVISKSGKTTEPAIAFRIFRELLESKYGEEEAAKRIYVTTDKCKGTLKELSNKVGYETFVVPDDVGGRYSVLTAVGLLPIAVSGCDIDKMMQGAADARNAYCDEDLDKNDCYKYAALRNILYRKGKSVEMMVSYEPDYTMMNEWFKQLFGESEGKDHKGIFPASAVFSTDLHSMGQFIQDGTRLMFETAVVFDEPKHEVTIKEEKSNSDGLNFLAGKTMSYVNRKAFEGTVLAHVDGGVPNIILELPKMDEYNFGYLVYFLEKACAVSGYTLGVNPFNQPGVESYKKNMFALLGKPGYEDQKAELEARLGK